MEEEKMARRVRLSTKLMLLGIGGVVAFAAVLAWVYLKIEERIYDEKRANVRNVTEVAFALLTDYETRAKNGEFSTEEAQKRAIVRVKNLRYKEKEYFWINDLGPKMIMHPYKPELDGKDLSSFKDPNGKHLFIEFVNVCKSKGDGYVDYMWPKPGVSETKPAPKISYVKLFPSWGWVIGSGIYVDDVEQELVEVRYVFALITFFLFISGFFLTYRFARSTARPIMSAVGGLDAIANAVSEASDHVASASQQLAEGATEQAAAIEETSASLEQIASMTKKNAEHANHADRLMKETDAIVGRASQSMSGLKISMEEISRASEDTQKIIKTIDEIAFQTNLLALNAAVEAARAGEAGAGFAVVADEVRNLALRAAEAARNTATLIEGTVKRVNTGSELVRKTTAEFSEVASIVTKTGELVGEIAVASKEQAEGIDHLNGAVSEMDRIVQQNASTAEQTASAAEQMRAHTDEVGGFLADLVAVVGVAKVKENFGNKAQKDGRNAKGSGKAVFCDTTPPVRLRTQAAIQQSNSKGKDPNTPKRGSKEIRPDQLIPFENEASDDF
jgi:methyl-accepting chemotaxis protein